MSFAPLHDSNLLGLEAVEAVNQRIDLRFESGCVGVRVRRKDSVNKRDERLLLRRGGYGDGKQLNILFEPSPSCLIKFCTNPVKIS